jgi:hypothetical protein
MFTKKTGIMKKIRIIPDRSYQGEGISRGLARCLLVYYADQNLTGEGMYIGSIAFRTPECTYFSLSWSDSKDAGVHKRTFTLGTSMRWSIHGRPSDLLTRLIEYDIITCKQLPGFQGNIMLPVPAPNSLPGFHPLFETIPSRGKVTFSYRVTGNTIEVQAEVFTPVMSQDTLYMLNELSAAWFTSGWDGKRSVSPPPGWEKIRSTQLPVFLVDPEHGIRFFMSRPSASPPVPLSPYRGKEQTGDVCWAGFCIELGPFDGSQGLPKVQYSFGFAEGECP